MDALLLFLDTLVTELKLLYYLEYTDRLLNHLDYLDAVVSLSEIRSSEEYRKLQ